MIFNLNKSHNRMYSRQYQKNLHFQGNNINYKFDMFLKYQVID